MEVRTGSKSWGYSRRPKNWKRIMNEELDEELDEDDPQVKYWLTHPFEISSEIEEMLKLEPPPEVEDKPKIEASIEMPKIEMPKIGQGLESKASVGASIEKPKITATVTSRPKPGDYRPSPDSSFSY